MTYFKKIFKFAIPYKKYIFLNIFFNILYALFSALSFLSLMPMLEVLFGDNKRTYIKPEFDNLSNFGNNLEEWLNFQVSSYAGDDPKKALIFVILTIIILFFFKNFFNYIAMFFITFLRNGVLKDLRESVYKKIITLPLPFFSEKKKGDVISRITADVLEIQHSFLSVLELIVREPLTIFFTILAMFLISFKLTAFVLFFIPISGFIISLIGKSLKNTSNLVQEEQSEILSITEETLQGLKIIKGFVAELFFIDRFQKTNNKFYNYSNKLINRQNLASPISEFLGISVIGVLLWYGGQLVLIDLQLNPAAFLTYMGLAYGVLTPAKAISKASYSIKKGNAAAHRVIEILESESSIKDAKNPIKKSNFKNEISFKNVSFKYEKENILKQMSFKIQKGQTVAIVGQSGSGKSTIANLIPRFYDVSEGDISIDGVNIKDLLKKAANGCPIVLLDRQCGQELSPQWNRDGWYDFFDLLCVTDRTLKHPKKIKIKPWQIGVIKEVYSELVKHQHYDGDENWVLHNFRVGHSLRDLVLNKWEEGKGFNLERKIIVDSPSKVNKELLQATGSRYNTSYFQAISQAPYFLVIGG